LRNLPRDLKLPPADTNVNADYHVAGSVLPTNLRGDLRFEPSSVAGAQIAGGSTAGFRVNGKAIDYTAARVIEGSAKRVTSNRVLALNISSSFLRWVMVV
jgi:hypothetical protein